MSSNEKLNTTEMIHRLEIKVKLLEEKVNEQIYAIGVNASGKSVEIAETNSKVNATESNISDTYTPRIYNVGEYTIYNNLLWKCLVRNSNTPTEGAEWRQVSLAQMIIDLNNRVTKLEEV